MTEPRRLTAEMRQEIQRKLDGEHPSDVPGRLKPALVDLHNALHDLDLADKEIALMDTLYDQNQEALREQASELAAANSQIAACALEMMRVGWKRGETIGAIQRGSPPEYCLFCEADYPNHTSGCICQDIEAFAASHTAQAIAQARREALREVWTAIAALKKPHEKVKDMLRKIMDAPKEEGEG